jgi:penicillin-insensitive murein endopeptidase
MLLVRRIALPFVILVAAAAANAEAPASESVCFGSPSDGHLENGQRLPRSGSNFQPYSTLGVLAGRTYVHSRVRRVVVAAYGTLAKSIPGIVFIYGETGFRDGGPFKPHRTHQNGLSLDHMVPVIDEDGKSVTLPTNLFNKFGYAIDFDAHGRFEALTIDSRALSELILHLHKAAIEEGIEIQRVIFDPKLQPLLHKTTNWEYLRNHIQFSKKRAWVRHDEHIHVDFRVPCS